MTSQQEIPGFHTDEGRCLVYPLSKDCLVNTAQDILDLLMSVQYHFGWNTVLLFTTNISTDFFDLKTGFAGEILQKVSNYRFNLIIVGDLSSYSSNSFKDFVHESNRMRQVVFLKDEGEIDSVLAFWKARN